MISPHEYEKETWQMTENEKLENISHLKEKRNMMRHLNIWKSYWNVGTTYVSVSFIYKKLCFNLE